MKTLSFIAATGIAASFAFATPASAALITGPACSITDITPSAQACAGFYLGQYLSGNATDIADQTTALAALGFAWDGNFAAVEKISGLAGLKVIDFTTLLQGVTYVAFHFGGGTGSPTGPGDGGSTAFYRIDAGAGLDKLTLAYNSSSDAVLYKTSPTAVPEPATWAMMLAGMGLAGAAMRRRKVRTSLSFS